MSEILYNFAPTTPLSKTSAATSRTFKKSEATLTISQRPRNGIQRRLPRIRSGTPKDQCNLETPDQPRRQKFEQDQQDTMQALDRANAATFDHHREARARPAGGPAPRDSPHYRL